MNEMGALTKRTKPKTTRMKEVSPEKQRLIELSVGSNGVNGSPSSTTVAALVIPSSHFNCAAASSQSDGSNRRIWLRRAWGIHFLIAVTVLTVGIVDNHQSR